MASYIGFSTSGIMEFVVATGWPLPVCTLVEFVGILLFWSADASTFPFRSLVISYGTALRGALERQRSTMQTNAIKQMKRRTSTAPAIPAMNSSCRRPSVPSVGVGKAVRDGLPTPIIGGDLLEVCVKDTVKLGISAMLVVEFLYGVVECVSESVAFGIADAEGVGVIVRDIVDFFISIEAFPGIDIVGSKDLITLLGPMSKNEVYT